MTDNIIPLRARTYTAKTFKVFASGLEFQISGTLDGFMDFCIVEANGSWRTYLLTCDDARALTAALNSSAADIQANCLFDRDALLVDAR